MKNTPLNPLSRGEARCLWLRVSPPLKGDKSDQISWADFGGCFIQNNSEITPLKTIQKEFSWFFQSLINFFPITGISPRFRNSKIAELTNTAIANPNSVPPSPITSIPNTVKWLMIAPPITPKAITAPSQVVLGISSKIEAISSATPDAYRPNGSKPTVSNMYMLSGAPVNLKYKVCSMIKAATNLRIQLKMVIFEFIQIWLIRPNLVNLTQPTITNR